MNQALLLYLFHLQLQSSVSDSEIIVCLQKNSNIYIFTVYTDLYKFLGVGYSSQPNPHTQSLDYIVGGQHSLNLHAKAIYQAIFPFIVYPFPPHNLSLIFTVHNKLYQKIRDSTSNLLQVNTHMKSNNFYWHNQVSYRLLRCHSP